MTAVAVREPGAATVLARAAAAEWVRLRTVRTTWWCLLAAALATVGIGTATAVDEAEMADVLGVAPGTVKSRLHRARAAFRERWTA